MLNVLKKFFNNEEKEIVIPNEINVKITLGAESLKPILEQLNNVKPVELKSPVVPMLSEVTEKTLIDNEKIAGECKEEIVVKEKQSKEPKIKLTEEEKKKLGIHFNGDVYCCSWSKIPSHLKTKSALEKMGLVVPNKIAAYRYTKRNGKTYNLYNLNDAREVTIYQDWKSVPRYYKSVNQLRGAGLCKTGNVVAKVKTGNERYTDLYDWNEAKSETLFVSKYSPLKDGEWLSNTEKYVILDTETTGLGEARNDEIIQLSQKVKASFPMLFLYSKMPNPI